ncbi:MAG TPA: pyridoxal-dependent decarboxylase [Candidatus Polarisedimenticolaceae bacterium]|nr:pyridoxal-dependent decarboxylase [Candidatus Polarisedimenticolaceae bacterium]
MADEPEAGPTPAQRGLGDMEPSEFRDAAHDVADRVADYLAGLERYRVLPAIEPGTVRAALPEAPPAEPEPLGAILDDYARWIEPNITHWQHPGFMAYFNSVASGPGILGEWLSAALNSNVMLWRNAPASTELEERVVAWLRQMLGLPADFDGMLTDTASISSLLALTAARHVVPGLDARDEGLAGRPGLARLRLYASAEAHSSIDKAAIVTGIGRAGVRRIETDAEYRMRPAALEAALVEDRAAGWLPYCVVATLGTTSSTSVDPVAAIAAICRREKLWLHVDAAYGGAAAIAPELRPAFAGWEQADSIVFNPHKWMFTPFDASLLLFRDPEAFRGAFSLVPEYLRTPETGAHNFNEYGVQLGRRFRALKLWMHIRWFGVEGIAARIREHCRLARELAEWIAADPDWELLAPVPFSVVCFRFRGAPAAELDRINEAILAAVNRGGRFYLSHTRLAGRLTLRVALGNPRATAAHVAGCWQALREAAGEVS